MNAPKRSRARVLIPEGLQKLRERVRSHEVDENAGFKYTLERLGELTGLDPETVKNVLDCKGSDKRTIARCFETFGLTLADGDHIPATQATATVDPNFVGRDEAIVDLNTLVSRNAKVIVIQARGGVGKTTLARKYLQQEFGSFLEFPIAKETKDIASIEGLLEEKLRQLGEEPGREFLVSLDRLKRKLQAERIGILIDNLEPALDSAGKFIEAHRRYVELLRVLSDPIVQSITLITSRERLREADVTVQHYPLRSLDVQAWAQFFQSRSINADTPALATLHDAYGGNAKAMDIISGAVLEDFSGDVEAYWQANQDDLFIERDLEDLVIKQFSRLQELDPDAYNLLCRMGCYRYQDVPTVPIEGLFCLLWDVPENRHRRVIKSLQDRSLVDFEDTEFWLHPVIRAEATNRSKKGQDWRLANCKAAEFWTNSIKVIADITDATKALEAYYHYLDIQDFEGAGTVILARRDCRSASYTKLELGRSLHRLGLIQQTINLTSGIIANIQSKRYQSRLYNILAVPNRIMGNIHDSIKYHQLAIDLATDYYKTLPCKEDSDLLDLKSVNINALQGTILCQLELWELEAALGNLKRISVNDVKSLENSTNTYGAIYKYMIECLFSILYSYLEEQQKATEFIIKADSKMKADHEIGTGFRVMLLAIAYMNVGLLDRALEMCLQVIEHCERLSYHGTQTIAINCLAEIYRKQGRFELAIDNHLKALEISKEWRSLRDLAQAHYQLGLTYKTIGEFKKSDENFREAIRLFTEMEAPKQVERVRQSMQNSL
jgi:tetratricopeptide (TPR) repeat protein